MTTDEATPEPRKIRVSSEDVDDDGFVSVWNIAAFTCDGEAEATRETAAKLLCFLCKKKCDFVVTSTANAEYLDDWFERDTKLLYDWKPESEHVDVVAQHAEVPAEAFLVFLQNQRFNYKTKYNPTRAERVEWFKEVWNVG